MNPGSAGVPPAKKRRAAQHRRPPAASADSRNCDSLNPSAGETPALPGTPPAHIDATGWHSRGFLPHFDGVGMVQHITFRLADSLPQAVLHGLEQELAHLGESEVALERRRLIENALDRGYGSCALAQPAAAQIIEKAFFHGDSTRYSLLAWVIMPNHCHVLIRLSEAMALSRIVHSWKSYTGHVLAKMSAGTLAGETPALPKAFPGWQRDYWDRYIRDEYHFWRAREYIHDNPVKAGLCPQASDWPFSSARFQETA